MSAHMDFAFLVERTLLNIIWAVVKPTVGALTSPGKLIRFPPKLSRVQCVLYFCGNISATIVP